MRKDLIILIGVLIIGAFLRIWQLGQIPISLDWDEAALAYNAYSILETGKDEYGSTFPIVLRSFDDYKPALYAYIAIPFVKLFGLTEFVVRIVSSVSGIFGILITYLLVKELFNRKDLALLSSLMLSISPWHIHFSRIAFEANLGLTLVLGSLLFFLKGLRNPLFLIFSSAFAPLSMYAYQAEKVFVPLFAILLFAIYRKQIFAIPKKYLLTAFLTGIIISFPLLTYTLTNKDALTRATGTSIFANRTSLPDFISDFDLAVRNLKNIENNDFLGLVFDNRRVIYTRQLLSNYFWHYDPNWLILEGEIVNKNITNLRHQAYQMGNLYLWELPFILIGIYFLIFSKFKKETKFLIFGWLLIVPIPSSITWDVPNSVRTITFLPTFQILTALGLLFLLDKLNVLFRKGSMLIKPLIITSFALLIIFNIVYYLNQYFVQYNYFTSSFWQYGYKELIPEIQKIEEDYDKVIISTKIPLDQSYIFFLFHLKYPPKDYQKVSKQFSGIYKSFHKVGPYEFRDLSGTSKYIPDTLYVGAPKDFEGFKNLRVIRTIHFLDGSTAFQLVDNRTEF